MPKWIVNLTEEDKEGLERIRAYLGVRSHAEAFRAILRKFDGRDDPIPRKPDRPLVREMGNTAQAHAAKVADQAGRYERRDTGAGWGFNPKGRK